jgi:hypothetical protein
VSDKPTQVMSLDELMDLAAEPRDTVTAPIPATPMPAPLNPAAPRPSAKAPAEPDMRQRLIADAKEWLKQGDNALITWTAAVACLLLLVVAAL